jgi:hypothetical protein
LVASNGAGTTAGADKTFTTPPSAPTAVTGGATRSATFAALLGQITKNGAATTYHFDYGETTGYGKSTPNVTSQVAVADPEKVSAVITGLTAGKTYHYRLVAVNSAGTTPGADATFTTLAKQKPAFSAKAKPSRDKKAPYVYKVSGKATLPVGMTATEGCSGRVTITLKFGKKTVATKKAKVTTTCTYSAKLTASKKVKLPKSGKLKGSAKFGGNAALSSVTKKFTVKFG